MSLGRVEGLASAPSCRDYDKNWANKIGDRYLSIKVTRIKDAKFHDAALNNFARLLMSAALASPITK